MKYRVIHKSVKQLKHSQQIKYSTDHGKSYGSRERNSPRFFRNMAGFYATVQLVPHACQLITVDQNHSSTYTVQKIWKIEWGGGTKTVYFTNPQKKVSHGVKSGDRGGHRINASSPFPVRPKHLCGKLRLRYTRTSL